MFRPAEDDCISKLVQAKYTNVLISLSFPSPPIPYLVAMNAPNIYGGVGENILKHTVKRINSTKRRIHFLNECIEEKVVPPSAPKHLKDGPLPFKPSAKTWIKENIRDLKNKLEVDLHKKKSLTTEGIRLPDYIQRQLQKADEDGQRSLERKLEQAINNSKWRTIGRHDIYVNLSDRILTDVEKEALSFGPKFDTGKQKKDLADTLITNHRWHDSYIDQGLVLATVVSAKGTQSSLPRRYIRALKDLRNDQSIIITTADKGGGFVIMNRTDYDTKMGSLLDDPTTYKKVSKDNSITKSKLFIKEIRNILKDSDEEGKKLLHLLPQNPRIPSMRGLPKIHKQGIPCRPITNGTGSAPHDLARELAKPLTKILGSISGCHLKNSTDLINRLKERRFRNKKLVGLDVVSLFTMVPINEALTALR